LGQRPSVPVTQCRKEKLQHEEGPRAKKTSLITDPATIFRAVWAMIFTERGEEEAGREDGGNLCRGPLVEETMKDRNVKRLLMEVRSKGA